MLGNESIHFNINYSELEGLLPEASYKSKGLCSTNIAKQKVDAWRGSSSVGYIQIAKVLKSEVYGVQNQLLIEIISMFNFFAKYNLGICNSESGIVTNCIAIKDDSRINFYYHDDGTYLYIYMTNLNNYVSRKVLSAPTLNNEIGNIVFVDSIDTGEKFAKN